MGGGAGIAASRDPRIRVSGHGGVRGECRASGVPPAPQACSQWQTPRTPNPVRSLCCSSRHRGIKTFFRRPRSRAPAPGGAVHCAVLRRAPFAVTHEHEQQHVSIATVGEETRAPAVPKT